MFFLNEKIAEKVHLLRGYEKEGDPNYCVVASLCGDQSGKYEIKGFLSSKTLSISDLKALFKYLKALKLVLYANILESDFEGFYSNHRFKKMIFS